MTDVLVRLTAASSGAAASGWVPADEVAAVGHLECRPWAPDADGARLHLEAPDRLLLPASMPPVRLVAGEAVLHLAPVAAIDGWCWQIIERTPRGKTRYVLVPDSVATIDYADLVGVDPATLDPTAVPEAAWWAAIEGIGGDIGQAVADYLDANPPTADVTMADLTGHAADTTAVHGIADTSALVVATDARLSDARTPTAHTHTLADVTDYTAPDLSGYVTTSDARLSDARTPLAHTHAIADTTGLQSALDGKAATGHTHAELHTHANAAALALVSGTNTGDQDLSGLAPASHNHTASQISDSTTTGRTLITAATATAARTAISAAPALGADDNYVTNAEKAALHSHANKTALDAVSGTNTGDQDLSGYATTASLATVATTGAYTDLTGKPTIPDSPDDIGAAAASHTHDDRYYTETEADALFAPAAQTINAQTGTTYTLVASDAGKLVTLTNSAAITLTVPAATFTAGQRVDCLVAGAGMVTSVGSSCTVNGTPSLVSRAQWSAFTVLFTSATTAVVVGDLASA